MLAKQELQGSEHLIKEWLTEYQSLSHVELHTFANTVIHNEELLGAIFSVADEKFRHHELLEPVCNQLFSFYRSQEIQLQRFVIQCIPTMIAVYLASYCREVEVLLLGIYNLEVVDETGAPRVHSFRLPTLSQASIYHEPISTSSSVLTENALSRLDKAEAQTITVGPFPQVESLNNRNRLRVMTILMNIFNNNLSYVTKTSLTFLCKSYSKLVRQGFAWQQGHYKRSSYGSESSISTSLPYQQRIGPHRVPLSPAFLIEVLHSVYFAMFNGLSQFALQSLEDIHTRATYELFTEVLLVTNSIRSSLRILPVGGHERQMGISIALSPTTSTTTVSKSIITNASFRTKKLPDDIPIQEKDGEHLKSITEEDENVQDKSKTPSSFRNKESKTKNFLFSKLKKATTTTPETSSVPNSAASTNQLSTSSASIPSSLSTSSLTPSDGKKEKEKRRSEILVDSVVSKMAALGGGSKTAALVTLNGDGGGCSSSSDNTMTAATTTTTTMATPSVMIVGRKGSSSAMSSAGDAVATLATTETSEELDDDTTSFGTISEMDDVSSTTSFSSSKHDVVVTLVDGRVVTSSSPPSKTLPGAANSSNTVMHTMV